MYLSLLTPLNLGSWSLRHRVVMAPVNRLAALPAQATPSAALARYYGLRASPGGLIVAEAAAVAHGGIAQAGTAGMFTPAQVHAWRTVTDAVHGRGGIIVAQLWHAGRLARAEVAGAPSVSASAVAARGPVFAPALQQGPHPVPAALDDDGIDAVIDHYRQAAENAADAGFDGVELSCANGCLADQFLHSHVNVREDRYGGSVENRARFLVDAIQTLTSVWGAGRVGVRLSPQGRINDVDDADPEALMDHVLQRLVQEGVAYVHIMEPGAAGGMQAPTIPLPALQAMRWRNAFGGPLLLSGGFDPRRAEEAVATGCADAVAFGRAFIANPDLPERLAKGLPLAPFDPASVRWGAGE